MDKNNKRYLLIGIIAAVVFTIVAFVAPFVKTPTFFAAYIFGLIAVVLLIVVSMMIEGSREVRSKFLSWAIMDVAIRYSIAQLILSLIFMIMSTWQTWILIVVSILLLAFCCVGLIAADAGKEEIERIDKQVKEKVFYIREMQAEIECLIIKTEDTILKKNLKELVEKIRYSDPMSSEQLYALEKKIIEKTGILQELVKTGAIEEANNLCKEIQNLFIERNNKCLFLK